MVKVLFMLNSQPAATYRCSTKSRDSKNNQSPRSRSAQPNRRTINVCHLTTLGRFAELCKSFVLTIRVSLRSTPALCSRPLR